MPRKAKGARLYYRKDEDIYIIRDGSKQIRTRCSGQHREEAEKRLAEYIDGKHEVTSSSRPDQVTLADVMIVYADDKGGEVARPKDLGYNIDALNEFWGDRSVSQINGDTCRAYAKRRSTPAQARRELETLRAAVKHFHRERGLDSVPGFTLPPKAIARDRWLTRDEVAKLLWACRKTKNKHVARLILIGVYTGTRSGAVLSLQWLPNMTGGYPDLDKGVLYREAPRQRQTKKRKPPVRLPRKLVGHMRRWKKADKGLRHVIHYKGEPVRKLRRSWSTVRAKADIGNDVVIHTLKHTAGTWLMQRGVDRWEAAGYLGITVETLEQTYGHHHPDYQKNAAEAL